jgi:hypothetical protein
MERLLRRVEKNALGLSVGICQGSMSAGGLEDGDVERSRKKCSADVTVVALPVVVLKPGIRSPAAM